MRVCVQVSLWETRLSDLDEYLLNLNAIQRRWVYLEPIFGRGALPREEARFKRVDEDFRCGIPSFFYQMLNHKAVFLTLDFFAKARFTTFFFFFYF